MTNIIKTRVAAIKRVMFASLGLLLLLPTGSNAGDSSYTGHTCGVELNNVEWNIEDANFVGKRADTDQSNLLAKLAAADAKIILKKYSNAIDKLDEISDKATTLAGASKLKDAYGINIAVEAAIGCVGDYLK